MSLDLSALPPSLVGHSTRIAGGQMSVSTYPLQMPGRPGSRSAVNSFSPGSRLRLMRLLLRLPWPAEEIALMTLTFATDVEGKYAKACLNKLHVWLDYQYPTAEVVWKLEYQRRGVPHFHLLVRPLPGSSFPDDFTSQVEGQWRYRMGCGFIDRRDVFSRGGVIRYMANYLTKKEGGEKAYQERVPEGAWSGRFWGVWGHPELMPEFVAELTHNQFQYVLFVVNDRLERGGVEFRLRASKSSSRYDPALAYLIRGIVAGELPTDVELSVMTPEERSRWHYYVDSGVLRFLAENFPAADEEECQSVGLELS